MPLGPGGYDSNGIWLYGEDDSEALASDLLNVGMQSVSDALGAGFGKILQVVSTTKTDTFSTTSTSFVDVTGLSATITPGSTSSKIFVIFSVAVVASTNNIIRLQLVRDSTAIGGGTPAGSRPSAMSSYYGGIVGGLQTDKLGGEFLDSPSTTALTTYKIQALTNTGTAFVNQTVDDPNSALGSRLSSTITLMEVAG